MCLTLRCKQRRHFAAALQEVMEFAVPLTTNEVLQGKSSALGLPMIPTMGWEALPSSKHIHTPASI